MIPYATPRDVPALASALVAHHARESRYYLAWLAGEDGPLVEDDDAWWSSLDDARTALADLAREMRDECVGDAIDEYAIVRGCDAPVVVCRITRDGREILTEQTAVWS
jgi:hypothetical protein